MLNSKTLKIALLALVTVACAHKPSAALASGNVSSGGIPPSDYEHDRTAIATILESQLVRQALDNHDRQFETGIMSITPKDTSHSIWIIATKLCSLEVQFTATCHSNTPRCDFEAKPLTGCSN